MLRRGIQLAWRRSHRGIYSPGQIGRERMRARLAGERRERCKALKMGVNVTAQRAGVSLSLIGSTPELPKRRYCTVLASAMPDILFV